MAATHYNPLPQPDRIEDPVTYEEAACLFARTEHPAPVSTLRRYVREDGLATERVGPKRVVRVSWSDLLEAHRERTAAKLRASSDWP
ncbi:hypothetical protein [Streptomyces griseorubiginosus]|uniref:hypothetical protein n=1 Tax=Streptomyces griseorubiginosus TaxID=67304 RepID=UPI0033DECF74